MGHLSASEYKAKKLLKFNYDKSFSTVPSPHSSLQLLAQPLIIPQTLEHVLQAGAMPSTLQAQASNAQSIKQENLMQGA
jgi:hypothetical protein